MTGYYRDPSWPDRWHLFRTTKSPNWQLSYVISDGRSRYSSTHTPLLGKAIRQMRERVDGFVQWKESKLCIPKKPATASRQ